MFAMGSRYASLATCKYTDAAGNVARYVSRRFLPSGDSFQLLLLHTVMKGERLDNDTAEYMDDPQQFWRIADANEAMSPFDLVEEPGSLIRITLPQGAPGPSNA